MENKLSKDDFLGSITGSDNSNNVDAYYPEEQDVDIEDGTYPATVIDMSYQNIITKHNTHADLYKPLYQIAKGTHKGVTISDKGIWRFRSEPSNGVNKSNRGNIIYKKTLDMFGIDLEQVEVDGVILKRLPPLSKESIKGKHVLIDVTEDTYKANYTKQFGKIAVLNGKWEKDEQKES